MERQHQHRLSDRIAVHFTSIPGEPPKVWIVESPSMDGGAGGQIMLTWGEWLYLVNRLSWDPYLSMP